MEVTAPTAGLIEIAEALPNAHADGSTVYYILGSETFTVAVDDPTPSPGSGQAAGLDKVAFPPPRAMAISTRRAARSLPR